MRIDILYIAGCPNQSPTSELVREVVRSLGLDATIREVEVRYDEEAARMRFFGSPTVQVDGRDLEPGAESRGEHGLSCRTYGRSGVPPRALVERALLESSLRRAG